MRMKLLLAASAAALLAACSPEAPAPTVAAVPAKAALGEFGIDLTNADAAVKPGDDFFKYANGAWLATYKLPEDKARFGSFDVLGDKSENDVKSIIDGFAATPRRQVPTLRRRRISTPAGWMKRRWRHAASNR